VNSIADGVSIVLQRLVARFSAAAGACHHIRVSPMSERWLQGQAVEYAKHDDAV
jgi:hypothetical protein